MRHGWKIYAAHHRIEMPVEMASLKCQPSSINQSSARNNNAPAMGRFYGTYSWVSETALKRSSDTGRKTERRWLGLFHIQVELIKRKEGRKKGGGMEGGTLYTRPLWQSGSD